MHKAVLANLRRSGPGVSVARLISGRRCSILAGFSRESAGPRWIAKSSGDAIGIASVRKEYEALAYLASWAEPLGIPRIIDWEDTGGEVCLIVTGAAGSAAATPLRVDRRSPVPGYFNRAAEWLARFQQLVPARTSVSLATLSRAVADELQTQPGYGALLDGILGMLRNPGAAGDHAAPPIHGDFWATNVLLSDRQINVIDWDYFGPGFPFEDLFSFVIYQQYVMPNRYCTLPESYLHCIFSDSPVCQFVKRHFATLFSPDQARLYFYGFLGRRICRETTAAEQWRTLLERLAAAKYPAPCTPIS